MAGKNLRFMSRLVVDKSAVSRTEILNSDCVAVDNDLAMQSGNGMVRDPEIVFLAASDRIETRLENDFPRLRRSRVDHKAMHGALV